MFEIYLLQLDSVSTFKKGHTKNTGNLSKRYAVDWKKRENASCGPLESLELVLCLLEFDTLEYFF